MGGQRALRRELRDPRSLRSSAADEEHPLAAPAVDRAHAGKDRSSLVAEKSEVEAGQGIVVVEAMKMQNEIKSPKKGGVQKDFGCAGRHRECGRCTGNRRVRRSKIDAQRSPVPIPPSSKPALARPDNIEPALEVSLEMATYHQPGNAGDLCFYAVSSGA